MTVGDIVKIKTTGEQVYLLNAKGPGVWEIRRPVMALEGISFHESILFTEGELETLEDYAERKLQEYLIQVKAQRKLYKLETKLSKEFESEDALEARPAEPSVN